MRIKSLVPTLLILVSSAISISTGILLDQRSAAGTANFRAIYYAARSVLEHADPYRPNEFLRVYNAESGEYPSDPDQKYLFVRAVSVCVNLPTTLFLAAPFAMLSWHTSHLVWLALIGVAFTVAGFLAYDLGRDYAPRLSLLLVCIMLANSEVLFAVGNTAGIAVSLCVVGLWCLVRQRGAWAGSVLFALSLALKPHDSGLLWLLLMSLGGRLRKGAAWSLVIVACIALSSLLWISRVAPDWPHELSANLSTTSQRGDISDPGPSSISRKGSADVVIDLQSALSLIWDNPAFYNPAALLICGTLLIVILARTFLDRTEFPDAYLAIAAIATLSVLPTYHRPYDARILLLAVPGAAMLWAQGCQWGKFIAPLTVAATVFTADVPLAVVSVLTKGWDLVRMPFVQRLFALPVTRPAPLLLLLLTALFTFIYLRCRKVESRGGTLSQLGPSSQSEFRKLRAGHIAAGAEQ